MGSGVLSELLAAVCARTTRVHLDAHSASFSIYPRICHTLTFCLYDHLPTSKYGEFRFYVRLCIIIGVLMCQNVFPLTTRQIFELGFLISYHAARDVWTSFLLYDTISDMSEATSPRMPLVKLLDKSFHPRSNLIRLIVSHFSITFL